RLGDSRALDALAPLVYGELRRRAARSVRSRRGHSLQGTELVNEAFLRLVNADVSWADRAHFLAVATRAMRHILIDHARAKLHAKRGGGRPAAPLEDADIADPATWTDPARLLALDQALGELEKRDPQGARAVAMSIYGGMTVREIAEVLQLSKSGVQRKIRFSKAWLQRRVNSTAARG
ncbi:MAG: ECF-type sigma factor, partial [Acidobacteriota bacterium]